MRFSKEKFWKILHWMLDPFLAFISIFFVLGVIQDYLSEKADFAIEEVPIQEYPTLTLTFGHPSSLNRFFFSLSEIDIYYYKASSERIWYSDPLKLGENYLDGEESIHLRKGEMSYSINVKHNTTFRQSVSQTQRVGRFIKIVFRPEFMDIHPNFWDWWSLYVFFTNNDESYGVENFKFYDGTTKVYSIEAILRVMTYDHIYLKPKMRKYLKEKNQCRDEPFFSLFQHEFVTKVKEVCGNDACRPTELPDNPIRKCQTDKEMICARKVMTESLKKSIYRKSGPCSRIEYEATQRGQHLLSNLILQVQHLI